MSDYGVSVSVDAPMDEVVDRARTALADQGFGVLTEIDIAATMKATLDVDVPPPDHPRGLQRPLARQGLQVEPDLGLLLPCNVVVREDATGSTLMAVQPVLRGRRGHAERCRHAYDHQGRLGRRPTFLKWLRPTCI